jgi:hypothetical protein
MLSLSRWLKILCALCALWGSAAPAWAQDELVLVVRRNFGYSGGSQIQGSFRMEASGPEDLVSVTFKIDEAVIGIVTAPPFRLDFDTDDFAAGWHDLSAVGQTADGRTLTSTKRRFEFVTASQGWAATQRILISVFGAVGVLVLVALGLPFVWTFVRRPAALPPGAPRPYGIMGGAVCPKCGRPFSLHWWSFSMGAQRLDRCDHCSRWSLVKRASRDRLAEAERAERDAARPETPVRERSPEEKLRQQLDASRFFDER